MRLKTPVELVVAADAESMLIVRLTAAGVLARAGSTLDKMDSLKSAVEEACTCLVNQTNPPERMALRFSCEDDQLVFGAEGISESTPAGRYGRNGAGGRSLHSRIRGGRGVPVRSRWLAEGRGTARGALLKV